jgi:hypothetical protein
LALPLVFTQGPVLAMIPKHKTTREEKIAFTLRLFDSSNDGEIVAAVHALKRILQALGTDWDGLARGFEKVLNSNGGGAITQEDMRRAIDDAYAKGVQDAENSLHGVNDFHSTDGNAGWETIALYCQRNKHRLEVKHHDFIDKMASQTVWGREPSERQHQYLHSLFYKLGGKLT